MSEERSIQDYLDDILNAVYGEEVRDSIVGAITKCYEDGSAGSVDVIARGRLDVIEPVVDSTKQTADTNVLATLQAEKALSQDAIHDLNLCTETGKYYAATATIASGVSNQPSDKTADTTFAVIVLQHVATTNIIQILIDAQWKMWIRRAYSSGGTWTYGGWQRFLRSTDLSDINTALDTKANKVNAQLTGAPTATTASQGDNSTRIATTAYVDTGLSAKANKNNAELTGNPTAPTQTAGNNSTRIATTAFVTTAVSAMRTAVNTDLAAKANTASPTLTGTPKAPTVTSASDSSTKIATTAFVHSAINAIPDSTATGTRGFMPPQSMYYLENTKPVSGTRPDSTQYFTVASSSRLIVFNAVGDPASTQKAMVSVYITGDVAQTIEANSQFVTLPVPVGTPCFGIVVRGQTGVIPAYINSNGNVVSTMEIASGKRIYITLTYMTDSWDRWR